MEPYDKDYVVSLVSYLRENLDPIIKSFFFELNNPDTRYNASRAIKNVYAGLLETNSIYDYTVICDETNNTDDNELAIDTAFRPNEDSEEFIYLPLRVGPSKV